MENCVYEEKVPQFFFLHHLVLLAFYVALCKQWNANDKKGGSKKSEKLISFVLKMRKMEN